MRKKNDRLVEGFFCVVLLGFLMGVLGKVGVWAWFLDGKNVVVAW
jgi:hypothetical protein